MRNSSLLCTSSCIRAMMPTAGKEKKSYPQPKREALNAASDSANSRYFFFSGSLKPFALNAAPNGFSAPPPAGF